MSLSADLDSLAAELSLLTGYPVTRDPGAVFPPCGFLGMPDLATVTMDATAVNVPVYLVAPSPASKASGDWLLDHAAAWITAISAFPGVIVNPREMTAQTLSVDGGDFPAYLATAQVHTTT